MFVFYSYITLTDSISALSVTCLSHGITIGGGASGGEKGPPEETGWHTLSYG